MRFLLENTLMDLLMQEGIVTGMILAAIGLAFSLLAKRITRVVRGQESVEATDSILLTFKALGLVCILVALVLMVVALN